MIEAVPIKRVIDLLGGGYTQLSSPLMIGGVSFDFDAVLVGGDRAFDLVVVTDTVLESDRRLRQKVEALARALDVVGSRRSLTLVTVGPPPRSQTLDMLSRVARVLVVRPDAQETTAGLRDALAVLLPLDLPSAQAEAAEPFADLENWLRGQADQAGIARLVSASKDGPAAVTEALSELLRQPLVRFGAVE